MIAAMLTSSQLPSQPSRLTHTSPPRGGPRRRAGGATSAASACARALACLLALCWAGASSASASALPLVSPYGEVSHFGGYGTNAGQFVIPVGFAVDGEEPKAGLTPDGNAVYVLDQTVRGSGELVYRLQKLSSTGVPLGSTTFKDEYAASEPEGNANPLISLAVDHAKHRVYALVEGMVEIPGGDFVPVAQRLVAWSTIPNGSGELQPAEHYATIDKLTGAALVAGQSALEPSSLGEDLGTPEGLAVDPTTHDVIIEAQHGVGVNEAAGGPTVLQRVHTEGSESGQEGEAWLADVTIAPHEEVASGLFATTDGFGVDLFGPDKLNPPQSIPSLVDVKSNFKNPEPVVLAQDTSENLNWDQALSLNERFTPAGNGKINTNALTPFTAGSPVTEMSPSAQLATPLYAAVFGYPQFNPQARSQDAQAEGAAPFWTGNNRENSFIANMGIRLFEAKEVGGQISTRILTTIGGQSVGAQCNLDGEQISLAAGAQGSLFVLTQPNLQNNDSNDEVIEFAPGGSGECPKPEGQVKVTAQDGTALPTGAGGEYLVHKEELLRFDAGGVERKGETPFEYSWNFTGTGSPLVNMLQQITPYLWPSAVVENYKYSSTGSYEGSLQLYGDYGTSTFPFKVDVLEEVHPSASFEVLTAAPTAGGSVEFDASASAPGSGKGALDKYSWSFGDGSSAVTEHPKKSHVYAQAGAYTVELTVSDEAGDTSPVFKKEVDVTQVSTTTTSTTTSTATTSTTAAATSTTSTSPVLTSSTSAVSTSSDPGHQSHPVPAPALTRLQQLAKALKLCTKQPKKRRAACERQARKKYAPPKKKKKKK
jgi:PKD repeat protein